MTIDEAIKHCEEVAEAEEQKLKDWKGDYSHLQIIHSCKECAEEHRQLAEWLRELKELREQIRWIPCSERLPEEDGCYLVTTTGTNNDIIDIAYYTEGIWHKASRIKAWMPLPSSYQGKENET